MKTNSGREIPDPPTDPDERRRWKTMYHADLYGASPEQKQRILDAMSREQEHEKHTATIRVIVIGVCSFVGGTCLARGAAHGNSKLEEIGLLLLAIALGAILTAERAALTHVARIQLRAIWAAIMISRVFRRFR